MPIITRPAGLRVKELPKLAAWWDFSDPTSYGTLVSGTPATMRDKSGNGFSLTTGGSNVSPIVPRKSLTGLNAINGAGSNALSYTSPAALSVGSGELLVAYAAMYPTADGSGSRVLANDPGGGNWLIGPYSNNWALYNGAGFVGTPPAYPVGTWAVHTGVMSDSQTATYHHGNGDFLGSMAFAGFPGRLAIGLSFGENPHVVLGEILVLQTSAESVRLRVQDYLMRKWGAGQAMAQSRLLRPPLRRQFFQAGVAPTVDSILQPWWRQGGQAAIMSQ